MAVRFDDGGATVRTDGPRPFVSVRSFQLTVVSGPDEGLTFRPSSGKTSVGTHPSNDLAMTDRTVSRFHFEVRGDEAAADVRIVDLGSSNGTEVDGVRVRDAMLRSGQSIRAGSSVIRFDAVADEQFVPATRATRFGSLVGAADCMRATLARLETAAASDATIVLEGETGTGKGAAAEAIHAASARASKPFVVVDCGAIPANLLESELFGHEKGAFTGATSAHAGAFEAASTGTLFLDEIGELPADLQPKLLRALENRTIKRLGTTAQRRIDIRLIAATNRDLRAEVNAGRFRADLYYRLAVVRIVLPPLRDRLGDLPLLLDSLLGSLAAGRSAEYLRSPAFLETLARGAWPGNVRELRNHIERCLVFASPLSLDGEEIASARGAPVAIPVDAPYADARTAALEAFEHDYVRALLERHEGRVADAARAAGVHRVHLYRLMRRHGLRT
jgi:two-component system, NtrC family, response regulator GlrR